MSRWEIKKRKRFLINNSLKHSFQDIHQAVLDQKWINSQLSGSTLTAILISDEDQVFVASVGDSHAVMYQWDKDLNEEKERQRLLDLEVE
jgi:serine/threonine protein phosphatase PrpC